MKNLPYKLDVEIPSDKDYEVSFDEVLFALKLVWTVKDKGRYKKYIPLRTVRASNGYVLQRR